jgi:hypothetical protein
VAIDVFNLLSVLLLLLLLLLLCLDVKLDFLNGETMLGSDNSFEGIGVLALGFGLEGVNADFGGVNVAHVTLGLGLEEELGGLNIGTGEVTLFLLLILDSDLKSLSLTTSLL